MDMRLLRGIDLRLAAPSEPDAARCTQCRQHRHREPAGRRLALGDAGDAVGDHDTSAHGVTLAPDTGCTYDGAGGPGDCAVAATAVTNGPLKRVFVRPCRHACPGRGLRRVIPELI